MKSGDDAAADAIRGSSILAWPPEDDRAEQLPGTGSPRLFLVEPGQEPPVSADCCQVCGCGCGNCNYGRSPMATPGPTWIHSRPPACWAPLCRPRPKQQVIATVLIEHFNDTVAAQRVISAAWPGGIRKPTVLAALITALRFRIAWVGLEIWGSSTKGYVMRAMNAPVVKGAAGGLRPLRR